ncbi:MAG: phage tail tube protein [Alphaproteobacteria bacterium]
MTAASQGRTMLLRDGTGGSAPVIGALRQTLFQAAGTTVDVTDRGSAGQFRELLPAAGTMRVRIEAAGLLQGAAQSAVLMARVLARSVNSYRLDYNNGDVLSGPFQMTLFVVRGDVGGEQNYQLTLESAGALSFIAAS